MAQAAFSANPTVDPNDRFGPKYALPCGNQASNPSGLRSDRLDRGLNTDGRFGFILRATPSAADSFLGPRGCHLGGLVPSFWHAGYHPEGQWGQQDGHEVVRNRIFIDFGMICGFNFESFLDT